MIANMIRHIGRSILFGVVFVPIGVFMAGKPFQEAVAGGIGITVICLIAPFCANLSR